MPGFYTSVWHALWVPKGTPQDAINKLNAAMAEAVADAHVRTRFTDLGQEIPSGADLTPQALAKHHKAEIDKWFPIIREAGLKPQ